MLCYSVAARSLQSVAEVAKSAAPRHVTQSRNLESTTNYTSPKRAKRQLHQPFPQPAFMIAIATLVKTRSCQEWHSLPLRNNNSMYTNTRLRYIDLMSNIEDLLQDMAFDSRVYSGLSSSQSGSTPVVSEASSPSLRSRESVIVPMGRTGTPDGGAGGGNVRVVVRVRGFLPRGMICLFQCERSGTN
jgi:hypothetical protein